MSEPLPEGGGFSNLAERLWIVMWFCDGATVEASSVPGYNYLYHLDPSTEMREV